MRTRLKIALVLGALALAAAPAMALATQPAEPGGTHGKSGEEHGQGNGPHYEPAPPTPPGPGAGLPEKARAYGRYCQDQSKKHVAGQKGTPFSQCVTAMAKAAHNEKMTARQACKGMSKKHVKGEKGTPFSRCVVAAAQLRKAQQQPSS
jgi:hypothetical protein